MVRNTARVILDRVRKTRGEGDAFPVAYDRVLASKSDQYVDLRQAALGVLYLRNKLEGVLRERRAEIARVHQDICTSVEIGEERTSLALIHHKRVLLEELDALETELQEIRGEAEEAKDRLLRFRGEIRSLERERLRAVALLSNARARNRIDDAPEDRAGEAWLRDLETVREKVAHLLTERNLDRELARDHLDGRIDGLAGVTPCDGAQDELEMLKRRICRL